jgi:hypothetical protein
MFPLLRAGQKGQVKEHCFFEGGFLADNKPGMLNLLGD